MKPCDEDGRHAECGLALLISLAALALVSLIGLSLAINAGMDMKISDNFETMIRARNAALAGLRELTFRTEPPFARPSNTPAIIRWGEG